MRYLLPLLLLLAACGAPLPDSNVAFGVAQATEPTATLVPTPTPEPPTPTPTPVPTPTPEPIPTATPTPPPTPSAEAIEIYLTDLNEEDGLWIATGHMRNLSDATVPGITVRFTGYSGNGNVVARGEQYIGDMPGKAFDWRFQILVAYFGPQGINTWDFQAVN